MKLKIFFICILYFLLFTKSALAVPIIEITDKPDNIVAGQEFPVTASLKNLDQGVNYHLKGLGGSNFYDIFTWSDKVSNWLAWNASWNDFSEFTVNEATKSATLNLKFKSDTSAGVQNIKIRLRKVNEDTNYDSETLTINVSTPTPTPTPIPTATPNPTSTATSTPTSTATSTPKATKTPIPTKTPTPKPTVKVSSSPTSSEEKTSEETVSPSVGEIVLGIQDTQDIDVKNEVKSQRSVNPVSFILLFGGVSFLVASLVYYKKILNKNETDKPEDNSL